MAKCWLFFLLGKLCGSFRDNSLNQEGTYNIIYSLIFALNFYDFYPGSYINNHPMQPLFYYLKSVSLVTPFKRPLLHLPPDIEKTQGLFSAKRWKCMSPLPQVPLNSEFNVVLMSLAPLSFLR